MCFRWDSTLFFSTNRSSSSSSISSSRIVSQPIRLFIPFDADVVCFLRLLRAATVHFTLTPAPSTPPRPSCSSSPIHNSPPSPLRSFFRPSPPNTHAHLRVSPPPPQGRDAAVCTSLAPERRRSHREESHLFVIHSRWCVASAVANSLRCASFHQVAGRGGVATHPAKVTLEQRKTPELVRFKSNTHQSSVDQIIVHTRTKLLAHKPHWHTHEHAPTTAAAGRSQKWRLR